MTEKRDDAKEAAKAAAARAAAAEKKAAADARKAAKESAPAGAADPKGSAEKTPRFKEHYRKQVVPAMMKRFDWENIFQVPKIERIVVNIGVSEARENVQALDGAKDDLMAITGQLPQIRRAKKSISNFKLRQNMPIAVRVTLRGDRMWEFFDRLVSTALPRLRDFRGVNEKAFDGRGNFNLGLREQLIFPEISSDNTDKIRGMNITFVTTAGNDKAGFELLSLMGMPFRKPAAPRKG